MSAQDELIEKIDQGLAQLKLLTASSYHYNARELVFQHGKVKLYHYFATVKKPHTVPLLVVFATVNRPEILDLFPEKSFIRGLLDNGSDVYLLDWGYPDINDKAISFSDYVTDYLRHCVNYITKQTQFSKIDLLGICQGGLICLCYAALFQSINKLVLISTPVDFNTRDNIIAQVLKRIDVDLLVEVMGNVSGAWLTQFFISLRPFELVGKKYLRFIDNLADHQATARFLQVEKWLYDAPDQTGTSFSELIKEFYQANKLIKGELVLNGRHVALQNVTVPLLNVMAREDEIVPMSASRGLKKYVSSVYYAQKVFPSGHIGIYISDKVGQRIPKAIASWLRSEVNRNEKINS